MSTGIEVIIGSTRDYNLHAHTQYCDGRDTMSQIAESAGKEGFKYFAFTPHSPINVDSPCNMSRENMYEYLGELSRLRDEYSGRIELLASLEIDGMGEDFGPHIDYFQRLPLDFRLGSVHFVPNQDGVYIDCDGRYERFSGNLKEAYRGDLRYVVEKYFEQVLVMMERGGFDLLGHFDKIAGNAATSDPGIENQGWYEALVDDVVGHAQSAGLVVEINTKAFADKGRFFPAERWWPKLIAAGVPLAVDSDAHYASKVTSGRSEAFARLDGLAEQKRSANVNRRQEGPG